MTLLGRDREPFPPGLPPRCRACGMPLPEHLAGCPAVEVEKENERLRGALKRILDGDLDRNDYCDSLHPEETAEGIARAALSRGRPMPDPVPGEGEGRMARWLFVRPYSVLVAVALGMVGLAAGTLFTPWAGVGVAVVWVIALAWGASHA